MDINELIARTDGNDMAQVKVLQTALRNQGLYAGPIDGKWGGKTIDAVNAFKTDQRAAQERALRTQELRTQEAVAQNDPVGRVTRLATETLPYGVGIGTGLAMGRQYGRGLNALDARTADAATRLAAETGIAPAVAENELARMTQGRNRVVRNQFAGPAMLGLAGQATQNLIAPRFSDPQTRDIVNSIGVGENAAALGLLGHQIADLRNRSNPIDPVASAAIKSRAMTEAATQPPIIATETTTADAAMMAPRSHAERAIAAAKAGGATGIKTKADAISWLEQPGNITKDNRLAVAEELAIERGRNFAPRLSRAITALKNPGSYAVGPLIGATVGYDIAASDARAAGGGDDAARVQGLKGAAAGAGLTAGALYGGRKAGNALTQYMPNVAGATRVAGRMLGGATLPSLLDEATTPSPENIERDRRQLAAVLPSWLQSEAIASAGRRANAEEANASWGQMEQAYRDQMAAPKSEFDMAHDEFMKLMGPDTPANGNQNALATGRRFQ